MYELPQSVVPFAGRMTDVDSHEMMPAQMWIEEFGEVVRPWVDIVIAASEKSDGRNNANNMSIADYPGDVGEIDPETVWTAKGATAPAATDMRRRHELMDTMGVSRQLMFPTGPGLGGSILYASAEDRHFNMERFGVAKGQGYAFARDLMYANNEWAVGVAALSDRFRPVTPVFGDTPDDLFAMTRSLVDRGIRAVQLCAPRLPAGVSPASNDLDPFYAMLAEANVALTLHIGGDSLLFRTNDWNKAKAFEGFKDTPEVGMDPWTLSALHLASQNFIATMVTGGVFDRHPTLRVGVLEYCAHWIGPLAQMLDLWHDNNQSIHPVSFADGSKGRRLPMRPSEYISRNVRVAPFDFEPVGKYIEMFGLEDVYCFASDYPHIEGGRKPVDKFAASLEPLGHRVMEKFFVTNGGLLLA